MRCLPGSFRLLPALLPAPSQPSPSRRSQFAGAAEELSSSIVVNPYSTVTVSHAITRALKTAPSTAAKLARQMVDTVITRDAPSWARLILRDLSDFHPDAVGAAETVPLRLPWAMARAFAEHGGEEAKNALFLDYDGTLRSFERVPADAVPSHLSASQCIRVHLSASECI